MTTTATPPAITDTTKLTIVKLLADGRDTMFAAGVVGLDVDTVTRVASAHGYPDVDKLAWAADVLAKNTTPAPAPVHAASVPAAGPTPPRKVRTGARPVDEPDAPPRPVDDVRGLIARGLKSDRASTVRLAEKAKAAVDALTEAVAGDESARREAAARATERARAEAEVRRLETELAEAKKRLGGAAAKRTATGTHGAVAAAGLDPKVVRAWANANDVELRPSGRIPKTVVEQYLAANGGAR